MLDSGGSINMGTHIRGTGRVGTYSFGPEAHGVLAPGLGVEPTRPALEGEILTVGWPGKSLKLLIFSGE